MRRVGIGKRSAVSFQQTTHYISHVIRSFAQSDVGLVGFRLAHDLCRGVQLNSPTKELYDSSPVIGSQQLTGTVQGVRVQIHRP